MTVTLARASELRLILAAKTSGLPTTLEKAHFAPMLEGDAIHALEQAGLWFGPRSVLENTEIYRQIIPYIVLQCGHRLVSYVRTPAGGEPRLHGRISIGLGGHVDLADAVSCGSSIDLLATLNRAAEREVVEELGPVICNQKAWIGLLVDNGSPVGRMHIGLVGLWNITSLPDRVAEDAIGEVALQSAADLRNEVESLETWSSILLPWLQTTAQTLAPLSGQLDSQEPEPLRA